MYTCRYTYKICVYIQTHIFISTYILHKHTIDIQLNKDIEGHKGARGRITAVSEASRRLIDR